MNKFEAEKTALQKDVSGLTSKLVDAKVTICDLEEENVSYGRLSAGGGGRQRNMSGRIEWAVTTANSKRNVAECFHIFIVCSAKQALENQWPESKTFLH